MQAVILAADKGSMFSGVSGDIPRCLLPVARRSIIEHQIEALSQVGIRDVLVVVGHEANKIKRAVGNAVEYVENVRYKETGSLYSLWLAREFVQGPFVLLNCDLLFGHDIIELLMAKGSNTLVFDSTSRKGGEQTKVAVRDGKIVDLGKYLAPELACGESLGIACFDESGSKAFFARVGAMVDNGAVNSRATEAVRSASTEVDMKALNVSGLPWVEVHFPVDYERARKEVWPVMMKTRWKRSLHWRQTRYVLVALLLLLIACTAYGLIF